jgi:ferrochelatase
LDTTENKSTGPRGILFLQLGSPRTPATSDVRNYLRDFLSDPWLIDNRPPFWSLILRFFILPSRSPRVAEAYQSIWNGSDFPQIRYTDSFVQKIQALNPNIIVRHAYLLGKGPTLATAISDLNQHQCSQVQVIPLYPQFSEVTQFSAQEAFRLAYRLQNGVFSFVFSEFFHNTPAFYSNTAKQISQSAASHNPEVILLSFHGYPTRRILNGDPYYAHCMETANLIASQLAPELCSRLKISFQSRFGKEPWLTPGTSETLKELANSGVKKVMVLCPSFVSDNLESLEEIDIGLRKEFLEAGGSNFTTLPCLNDNPEWIRDFNEQVVHHHSYVDNSNALKWRERISPTAPAPLPQGPSHPSPGDPDSVLSPQAKSTLKIMFLILFLDLLGFSVIFPLFPAMLEYYMVEAGESGLLSALLKGIHHFTHLFPSANPTLQIVFFGGALSFIYSFLQFIMAPLLGRLSDKIGRKPVLLISLAGLSISYLVWGMAASFGLLLLSRVIGGIMSSNISTATAVVADVTTRQTRSAGMALIGIAFGLGFMCGPAIGGLLSLLDLSALFPVLKNYGINPFSAPALFSFILSITAFILVLKNFNETREVHKPAINSNESAFRLYLPAESNLRKAVLANFVFLSAFSGVEFILAFLTWERFAYSAFNNGMLFLYIGFIIIVVQGGYVRRKASQIGEVRLAIYGIFFLTAGLITIAFSEWQSLLWVGVLFLSTGSAIIMPCLSSLTSLLAPPGKQGEVMGSFRSLGALGRVIGPLSASLLFWNFGSGAPFLVCALALFIPWLLIRNLQNKNP